MQEVYKTRPLRPVHHERRCFVVKNVLVQVHVKMLGERHVLTHPGSQAGDTEDMKPPHGDARSSSASVSPASCHPRTRSPLSRASL